MNEHFTISLLEQMWTHSFLTYLMKSILLSDALCYWNVFALFYFVSDGNFEAKPLGAYIQGADLTEGSLHYKFGDLYLLYVLWFAC